MPAGDALRNDELGPLTGVLEDEELVDRGGLVYRQQLTGEDPRVVTTLGRKLATFTNLVRRVLAPTRARVLNPAQDNSRGFFDVVPMITRSSRRQISAVGRRPSSLWR